MAKTLTKPQALMEAEQKLAEQKKQEALRLADVRNGSSHAPATIHTGVSLLSHHRGAVGDIETVGCQQLR